jgi:hypothetical protein
MKFRGLGQLGVIALYGTMRAMTTTTKMVILCSVLFVAKAAFVVAQTGPEVEITAEPSHHLVLQNREVRVFDVTVAPQARTLTYRHRHDSVSVTLGAADILNAAVGRAPERLKLRDAETTFVSAGLADQVRNVGTTPFRSVTIELLQDDKARQSAPQKWDDERGLQILEGGTQDIVFVKDGARVSEIDLQPGGMLPGNKAATRRLLVAVSDVDLRSHGGGKATGEHLRAGEVAWVDRGASPTMMNISESQAKFILLEFH